jgi:hypothetical protein
LTKKSKEKVYATWNVRGIIDKEEELDGVLKQRNIKIAILSKTKKKIIRK